MQSIILAESVIANTAKSTYQKKYKCPYCDKRFVRAKLHIHIQNEHEDLIPEGYTALRVAFNTINHKTEGHCIMCGAVTDWNEDKGRYERLCNNPKCHEAYKKMVAERTKKKYGTERLQTDPEYAEYVQRKALAGRKMHGEYKFADGGVIEYFGSYEKKFLQFMDQVMHCKSEDILAPAPSIKYMYNGEQHLYIPDFYYIPYNLIIEIKDGGSNPNNHPHRTGEDELKLRAKEEAIRQLNEFSYVRVVNNDFSQVLSIMAVLKYNMAHRYKDPVVKVNESMLLETASTVDKNFKPKDRIELSSLKRVHITEAIIEKYKKQYPDLRHVRCKDTDTYKCDGYMWFDKENRVAQVGSCEYLDDGTKWIVSLDIMKDYKGHGLSKQILDFATKTMKCKYLSVDKNNKLAKMIYDEYGFKVYYEDDNMYYMTLEANPVKVNESTLLESVSNNYPKDLYNWMKANITYKSTGILLSPEEVEEYGYGDCHDQANYIHSKLSTKDISNGRLFVIEYNDLNSPAGKTHTAAYYKQNGKYYWIENAWYKQTGIHGPYNSIFNLKIAIANAWIWGNYKNLYIGSVNNSKIKNGMNLNDYVNACLPENEKMIKPFITNDTLNESILINEDDIYYNKNKFDSGEINLCFITGLSGSGKSTMGRDMQSHGIEHYDMDDLQVIADHFTLNDLKKYGDLIYSYFTGEGKKFYKTLKELKDEQIPESEYEDKLFPGFVHYAMKYAKAHKDKKFVLEGVWLFQKKWFTPEEFKDYAFYIKGTSMIISHIREAKRDSKDAGSKFKQGLAFVSCMTKNWKWYIIDEGQVNKFRKYFENLMTKNKFIESTSIGDDDQINDLIDICKRMATYEYICIDDKFNVLQNSRSNFDKHRTVSSSNFKKYNGGICYDYVNYMVGLLGKFKFKTFFNGYVEKDGQIDYTHTYILVYINDKVYWIEDSWKSHMGVFEFDSEDDAISYIVNIQSKGKEYFVVEYKPSSELVGISVIDFINIMNSKPEYNYKHNNSAKAFTIYSVKLDGRGNIIDEKYAKVSESGLLEDMSGTIAGALPLTPNPIPYESNKDNYYIIQHMENNAFAYSLTKDPVQYTMYSVDPEAKGFYKVFKSDKSKINKKYSTFKIRDRQKAKELYDELAKIESSNSKTFFAGDTSNDYIYQRLTEGSKIISDDQIRYDTRFEEVKNFNEEVQDICESVRNFILGDPITRLEEQVSTLSNLVNINESSNYVSSDYDMITSIEDYDNKVLKAKTAEQMGLIILYPEFKYGTCNKNTIDKLKKKYADFNALTKEKRTLSNRTAYHIFGYDNDTLYSKLLNLYVSTTMKSGGGSEGYSYNTMKYITPPIEQYYNPGEKIGTVSSDTKVARESFTDDYSWRQSVSKLCLEANNTSDTKKKNDLKNEIINLGWNPEIPFNEEAITRVKNMRHNLHIFTEVDAEEYIRNIHTFNEATYNQLKDKIVPVFICLFKGKSLHSRGIELYTGSEWSHAAMSFDSSMKQMYTFNMNPKVTSDGISKGFTIESIEAYWKIDPSIKFKVHALFVTKEQKAMMEDAIKWYVTHQNETKYSFKTIINIALKRVSDFGSEYANKTEMVCSQFVYTILAIADFKTKVTKDASLVSPGDLDTSIDDRLYSMFIGGIGLYSSKKIDRMVRQIIPTLPLDKYNI